MDDDVLMRAALEEARRGLGEGAMPIGAVVACDGEIVAAAHRRGIGSGLLDHPERVALGDAARRLLPAERRRSILCTTLEPCLMCMGAAMSAFVGRVVFAAAAPVDGASNVAEVWKPSRGHPDAAAPYAVPEVRGGVRADEALALIAEWLDRGAGGPEADFARLTIGAG